MKYLLWILAVISILFSFWNVEWYTNSNTNSIFNNKETDVPYCNNWECWIPEWVEAIKDIDWLVTDRSATEYIQDIVVYVLRFLAIIATILIIYAWFNLLTSAWDEEKAKKSKQIIIYTIIWIFIIFIAWPLIKFVLGIFTWA